MDRYVTKSSGLWSSKDTWEIEYEDPENPPEPELPEVPADGSYIKIKSEHEVIFDVDQQSFSSGISELVVDGKLIFLTEENKFLCLKMNNSITGLGEIVIGTESNPIPKNSAALIIFNNFYFIDTKKLMAYGQAKERLFYLIEDKIDDYHLKLKESELNWLMPGDKLIISNNDDRNPTTVPGESFVVSSFDDANKIITLESPLIRSIKKNRDVVILISKNITFKTLNTISPIFANPSINGTLVGVSFDGYEIDLKNYIYTWKIKNCVFDYTECLKRLQTETDNKGFLEKSIIINSYYSQKRLTTIPYDIMKGNIFINNYDENVSSSEDFGESFFI